MPKPAPRDWDLIVIGAGAAGLMCASVAARRGRRALVIDKARRAGRKILMSGGGKCNFTNLDVGPEHFRSANPHFVKSALSRYTQWHFIEQVDAAGIHWHEREHGQLFCDNSARDILDLLLTDCRDAGVEIALNESIDTVERDPAGYAVQTDQRELRCGALVVATGGLSIPSMGGDGLGYRLAEQFHLPLKARSAGLVPFTLTGTLQETSAALSGNAIPVRAQATSGPAFDDPMLFTHRGLSGPAMLQISNWWDSGQAITVDLSPQREIDALLLEAKRESPRAKLRGCLSQLWPRSVASALIALHADDPERPLGDWRDEALRGLADNWHQWRPKPAGTEGYRTAEVTRGGVDTDALSSQSMAARDVPDLYFIGEVVDVTGWLGGYNFQWAWASGVAAGNAV